MATDTTVQRHLRELFAGAVFGAALYSSGVYYPAVIISQLRFESYHMMQVMLGASAASAAAFFLAKRFKIADVKKRSSTDLGYFAYDGNVLGGLLIGVGMASSGACPGTVVVQMATGIESGLWVASGGLLGAAAFIAVKPSLPRSKSVSSSKPASTVSTSTPSTPSTISEALHTSERNVLYGWESLCALGLYVTKHIQANSLNTTSPIVDPIFGGPLIGLAQATSVALNGHSLGVSGVYEGIVRAALRLIGPADQKLRREPLITPSMTFAAGIFASAYILANSDVVTSAVAAQTFSASTFSVDPIIAAVAGGLMVFGARLCGGCTSGHAISGLATFSIASLVTTAAMFAGGVATAMTVWP